METLQDFFNIRLINSESIRITPYSILQMIIIIVAAWLIVLLFRKLMNRQVKSKRVDLGTSHAVINLVKYLVWVLAIGLALESIGVKLTLLLAGSAALLVGVGLGLQQIFRDIISGFFLLFDRSIEVGNVVELNNLVGRVQSIGLRTTRILTRDNITMIIPNSEFIEGFVINWSSMDELTRFHVNVGVAYGSDVRKVERVLLDCAGKNPDVSNQIAPFVRFNNFGDSSLDFQLYFWTQRSFEVENIKSDLRFAIDKAFRENDIRIPFPQHDVHLFRPEE
ncbi:MAG: mechanosensitive ion channel family protein [Bacteroidales bacterium]